ncbi:CAP domain-containing protein [Saccharopolyspora taberi]|uniref:SCP domain-containing protein n=1 Tax=Saccharopolyspora taberi TaxID=60895 RepID=A0ABN3VJX7_9PSEU
MRILGRAARMFGLIAPERSEADQILDMTNQARAEAGHPPLRFADALNRAALAHSADMAAGGFLSHTGTDGSDPADRAKAAGYPVGAIAENIACGSDDPLRTFQQWLESPEHCDNMLSPAFAEAGVGHDGDYWTLKLARPV